MRPISLIRVFLAAGAAASALPAQTSIDLAGEWERVLAGTRLDTVRVPSSYRPIGTVTLRRKFQLPEFGERSVLLRFEGVAHQAEVRIGGIKVGTMGPWTPYRFDITAQSRAGIKEIEVELTDWEVPLGPSGAWEAYGGIIRAVSIELRSKTYIDNARLDYTLSPKMDAVDCALSVFVNSRTQARGRVSARLLHGSTLISEQAAEVNVTAGESTVVLRWTVPAPTLWSPPVPHLYSLVVRISSPAGEDEFVTPVGFRKIEVSGSRFLLNGETLVLRGVCRHDIWLNQGHTLTEAQIEQDLEMIKGMGANFVRLVHYPHDPRVVQTAARLGLLVTEEPGFVWLQFRGMAPETLETGLGNLERTVRRDWNNPALFAVMVANESPITPEVMREAKRRVRALHPDLLVSSARVDSPEATLEASKRLMDEGDLDFYCYHPYTFDMDDFERVATVFSGKPLVFTEWGGRAIGDSPVMMQATTRRIGDLVETGRVAGHAFWSWSDLPEFSREGEENRDGILESGVVTEGRVPRPGVYTALASLFRYGPRSTAPPDRTPLVLRPVLAPLSQLSQFAPVSLQPLIDDPMQRKAWTQLEMVMQDFFANQGFTSRHWAQTGKKFWTWSAKELQVGEFPFQPPSHHDATEPVVLNNVRPKVVVPIGRKAARLLMLGNVTVPDGYPVTGKAGALIGSYTIVYSDGEREKVELRWAENVARSNMISVASRINPSAAKGERVIEFVKDRVREIYQTRLFAIQTKAKVIDHLECEVKFSAEQGPAPPRSVHHSKAATPGSEKQSLLLFALTVEISGTP